ncbi:MAG: UDP-glucose/GDP-mannose dehydrogenase family protein [Candidatus Pacebacteria bacterium]|nr:UDP-glucose/GDP-mannose dehydrogenase family protein [Candidatus Paceibacterota bacterium]
MSGINKKAKKRDIAIIGTGYVGLITGVCFASLGHNIICVDKDKNKIALLNNGQIPIYEPGLDKILKKHRKNILFTTDSKKAIEESGIIFIAVNTPTGKRGEIDMKYFKAAIREIATQIEEYKIIVNKSTVPVGTGEWVQKEIKKYYQGNFSVVSNPEFLREGSALKDFLKPDRIIIGAEDNKSKKIMLEIYSKIEAPLLVVDIKSAELIKYAANAFLATKISFINEIANLCEKINGDVVKVAEGIGLDKRIGPKFLNAGIGYGGSCFPKDVRGLDSIGKEYKYNFNIIKAVMLVNQKQQERFVRKIKKILNKIKGNRIGVWGLSFKPNTDDVRKSPAIAIIKELQKNINYKIQAYDPIAIENAKKEIPFKNIKYSKNAYEAAKNADILILITDWSEFSKINMQRVKKSMRQYYILDGRNQLNPENIKKLGFYYEGIGRK